MYILLREEKESVENPRGGVRHVIRAKGDYKINDLLKSESL